MKVTTLGEVCTFKYGKSLAAKDRTGSGNPVYGSNGIVGFHNAVQTDGPAIVVGRKGSYGEINFSSEACWPIDTTYFIDRTCTDLNLEWLKHLLPTLGLNTMNRSAAIPGLNREDAYRVPVVVPSSNEQRRIAAILDKVTALRTKRREALAHLAALPQSIFLQMFGDPMANDSGLPVAELQALLDQNRPLTYGILMPGPDQENGVKYIRVTDMQKGRIQESTVRSTTPEISEKYRRSMLRPGDLLMSIRGHVGRFAVVPASLDGANITQDTARLAITGAEVAYVRECLSTPGLQRWMVRHTKGVAVRGINLGDVRRIPIPVASVEMQRLFATKIGSIERLQDHGQAQLAELEALFAALQYRAFHGELR